MRFKKYFCLLIILVIFSSISINFLLIFQSNYNFRKIENDKNLISNHDLKSADFGDPISFIEQNATEIYRLFESINFTIDVSAFNYVNYTNMQISFSNGSVKDYPMELVGPYAIGEYKPKYNAPLGVQNVSFLVYNESGILLNAHTVYKNFTIKSNYMANFLPSNSYYVGDTMDISFVLNDFISNNISFEFNWNVTIVDTDDEDSQNNLINLENDIIQFKLKIENNTFTKLDETYYVKVNMTEKDTKKVYATYFPFNILNNIPEIIVSSINFSKDPLLRTESCRITLNVTDVETLPEDLLVNMILEDPEGNELAAVVLNHDDGNTFTKTFSIPANHPVGRYKANITVVDQDNKIGYYVTYLNVENNPPKINSFNTNGISMNNSVTILYGKDLTFTFDVSDKEGIAYVKVALIDKNNEWFNITREYKGPETRITIRTEDLRRGKWYVYVFVTDTDGETTGLIDDYNLAPQEIKIVSDVLSTVLPWITFIVGIILGILAGVGGSYKLIKTRLLEKKIGPSRKKEEVSVKKKYEKKKIKKVEEEPIKEEEEEVSEEEKEERVPYRKIKRKLK